MRKLQSLMAVAAAAFALNSAMAEVRSPLSVADEVVPHASITEPEENRPSDPSSRVDACASDPTRLGLSRIVEVDTESGPSFGGGHLDFLKDHEVVLTFDDGPSRRHTREILKALADHCTRATFFMVGRMALLDPEMVKEVANAGHTVGIHTWSHRNGGKISLPRATDDFELGLSAVSMALGRPAAPFFRYPYLSDNRAIASYVRSRSIAAWWVDVDSKDYMTHSAKLVRQRVMAQLKARKKGIILMHDIQPSTTAAIRDLLDDLHAGGFKVVHVVPKAAATTIASYDEQVGHMAKGKALASDAPAKARKNKTHASKKQGGERTNVKSPVTTKVPAKARQTARNKPEEQLPWLPQAFGY